MHHAFAKGFAATRSPEKMKNNPQKAVFLWLRPLKAKRITLSKMYRCFVARSMCVYRRQVHLNHYKANPYRSTGFVDCMDP